MLFVVIVGTCEPDDKPPDDVDAATAAAAAAAAAADCKLPIKLRPLNGKPFIKLLLPPLVNGLFIPIPPPLHCFI